MENARLNDERIDELVFQAGITEHSYCNSGHPDLDGYIVSQEKIDRLIRLIAQECATIVTNVKPGYRDYRLQIEEAMRDDCVAAINYYFGLNDEQTNSGAC